MAIDYILFMKQKKKEQIKPCSFFSSGIYANPNVMAKYSGSSSDLNNSINGSSGALNKTDLIKFVFEELNIDDKKTLDEVVEMTKKQIIN